MKWQRGRRFIPSSKGANLFCFAMRKLQRKALCTSAHTDFCKNCVLWFLRLEFVLHVVPLCWPCLILPL
jgi:hypothetical protein